MAANRGSAQTCVMDVYEREIKRASEAVDDEKTSLLIAQDGQERNGGRIKSVMSDSLSTTTAPTAPLWGNWMGEEGWKESELCHRQMLRAIPVAVYSCDGEGRITFYNLAAARLWGRVPELNKDLWCGSWKIFKPDGSPMPLDLCPMARTLREGRSIQGEEIIVEREDGTRRRVLPFPEPIRNSLGTVVGAVNTLVDVTERKSAA
jgi:PAS domain S-box-containing protein